MCWEACGNEKKKSEKWAGRILPDVLTLLSPQLNYNNRLGRAGRIAGQINHLLQSVNSNVSALLNLNKQRTGDPDSDKAWRGGERKRERGEGYFNLNECR